MGTTAAICLTAGSAFLIWRGSVFCGTPHLLSFLRLHGVQELFNGAFAAVATVEIDGARHDVWLTHRLTQVKRTQRNVETKRRGGLEPAIQALGGATMWTTTSSMKQ